MKIIGKFIPASKVESTFVESTIVEVQDGLVILKNGKRFVVSHANQNMIGMKVTITNKGRLLM